MEPAEGNWLTEMMRLSGVNPEQEEDDGEWAPYIPGMLSFEEEDVREREVRRALYLAEAQTLALIEDQEDLHELHDEGGEG